MKKVELLAPVGSFDKLNTALHFGADAVYLGGKDYGLRAFADNFDYEQLKKAVEIIGGRAQTECSGNVTKERLREIAEIGVDFVSCGALTHSAPILDFSLKNLKPIE